MANNEQADKIESLFRKAKVPFREVTVLGKFVHVDSTSGDAAHKAAEILVNGGFEVHVKKPTETYSRTWRVVAKHRNPMPARKTIKRRITKPPTAKQLAARAKFVKMVRAKAAKKKGSRKAVACSNPLSAVERKAAEANRKRLASLYAKKAELEKQEEHCGIGRGGDGKRAAIREKLAVLGDSLYEAQQKGTDYARRAWQNPARRKYHKGSIASAISAAKKAVQGKPLYVFGSHSGFSISESKPPSTQSYIKVMPDGSTEKGGYESPSDSFLDRPLKRRRNKTIITKPKRVIVLNPRKRNSSLGVAEILKRYADARLISYRRSLNDERQAAIAAKYATDDLMQDYRRNVRQFDEEYALRYITAELEDVERANAAHRNPTKTKSTRRKYRNGYLDLVIMGHAKKTPSGWSLGGKTFKQGKGIVPASRRGYYLDKATGTVFSKRERNVAQGFFDGNGVFHPIRSSSDYDSGTAGETGKKAIHTRSKKRKASLKKASQTARHKAETRKRKSTTSRLASRSLSRSVSLKAGSRLRNGIGFQSKVSEIAAIVKSEGWKEVTGGRLLQAIDTGEKEGVAKTEMLKAFARAGITKPRGKKIFEDWTYRISRGTRGKRMNPFVNACGYCGGPGGIAQGPGHSFHCSRYEKPKRKVKTISARKSKKANPSVKEIRKTFAGTIGKAQAVYAPIGTPKNVAKLGTLKLIDTENAKITPRGTVYLCADTKGKLHIVGGKNAPIYDGPAQSFGKINLIEYDAAKPHLYPGQGTIRFWHKLGEESGNKPTLFGDGKGGLKIKGGSYSITREGIRD